MKIEDKIYLPHVCSDCGIARLILRDDLHDNPTITCTECDGTMKRWAIHKDVPIPLFSSENEYYLTYTQRLREITGSPWNQNSGSSLAAVRKKVGQDLVEFPGMPEMIYLPSEYEAAQLRAELMAEKIEDIVVTLVYKAIYTSSKGGIYVESLRHSQVIGRIDELREQCTGSIKIMMVYSEETHRLFVWNDMPVDEKPLMPKYDQEYERKRTAYSNPASGV